MLAPRREDLLNTAPRLNLHSRLSDILTLRVIKFKRQRDNIPRDSRMSDGIDRDTLSVKPRPHFCHFHRDTEIRRISARRNHRWIYNRI